MCMNRKFQAMAASTTVTQGPRGYNMLAVCEAVREVALAHRDELSIRAANAIELRLRKVRGGQLLPLWSLLVLQGASAACERHSAVTSCACAGDAPRCCPLPPMVILVDCAL